MSLVASHPESVPHTPQLEADRGWKHHHNSTNNFPNIIKGCTEFAATPVFIRLTETKYENKKP